MSKKSKPGDGSHGKGKKGGGSEEILATMFSGTSSFSNFLSKITRLFR